MIENENWSEWKSENDKFRRRNGKMKQFEWKNGIKEKCWMNFLENGKKWKWKNWIELEEAKNYFLKEK